MSMHKINRTDQHSTLKWLQLLPQGTVRGFGSSCKSRVHLAVRTVYNTWLHLQCTYIDCTFMSESSKKREK